MRVEVRALEKRYTPECKVVDRVSFVIEPGEMFFLLGPSGCGKTTVLRMLAGFLPPDAGDIFFDGRRVNHLPPPARDTAMVFQNYALWPHMNVAENLAYGPRARGRSRAETAQRVEQALELTRLAPLAKRRPVELSGGQQQRVALARAVAAAPGLILLDEPLSNLDAGLRRELRGEFRQIRETARTTSLFVTHDQEEALGLADRIAIMHQGRIEQVGTPREIYERPQTEFVARFLGELQVLEPGDGWAVALGAPAGARVAYRPEAARLTAEGVRARVTQSLYLGSKTELRVALAPGPGTALRLTVPEPIAVGAEICFRVPPEKWIVLP